MWRGPFSSKTSESWQKWRSTDFQHRKIWKKFFWHRNIECWESFEMSFGEVSRVYGLFWVVNGCSKFEQRRVFMVNDAFCMLKTQEVFRHRKIKCWESLEMSSDWVWGRTGYFWGVNGRSKFERRLFCVKRRLFVCQTAPFWLVYVLSCNALSQFVLRPCWACRPQALKNAAVPDPSGGFI